MSKKKRELIKPAEMVKTTIRLPGELVRKAKHYAVDHDGDLQTVVQWALEKFLEAKS